MSKAEYWQRGESLDYTNTTEQKIEANTIVSFGSRVGVVGTPLLPKETGSVLVTGVFEMPKSSSNAINMGTTVYFDGKGITEAQGEVIAGYAVRAAEATDSIILVKLLG